MGQPPHPSASPPPHLQQQAQHPLSNYNASTEPSVLDSPMGNPSTPHSAAIPMNAPGTMGQGAPRMTAPMGTLPEPVRSNRFFPFLSLCFPRFLSFVAASKTDSTPFNWCRWAMKVLLVRLNDQLTIPLPRSLPPLPVSIPITQLEHPVT